MDNLSLGQGGSLAFTSGAWAEGTNAGTIQNAAAVTYTIDGRLYSKAITDNIAISFTGDDVYSQNATERNGGFTGQTGGSTRIYGIYLDTTGAVSILPGKIVSTTALAAGTAPLEWPTTLKGKCCVAAVRVAVTAGTTFVPGTTDLSAAGVTDTFYNLSSIPGEPLTA